MPDDRLFAAAPYDVQKGGVTTDAVSEWVSGFADTYDALTRVPEGDEAWGDDSIGAAFKAQYLPAHDDLVASVLGLAVAVRSAGKLTYDSGAHFERAQSDIVDDLQSGSVPGKRV